VATETCEIYENSVEIIMLTAKAKQSKTKLKQNKSNAQLH
jgi:hypothetical protein